MTQFSSPNATSTAGVDVVVSTSGWGGGCLARTCQPHRGEEGVVGLDVAVKDVSRDIGHCSVAVAESTLSVSVQ